MKLYFKTRKKKIETLISPLLKEFFHQNYFVLCSSDYNRQFSILNSISKKCSPQRNIQNSNTKIYGICKRIMTDKKISSSFKNHFLECRASCKSARFKTRVKSSLSRQKLIFPQSGKIEECVGSRDYDTDRWNLARIKWCVCTRVTVYILTCVVEINTRRATPSGWEARGGRAPFTNASHRLNVRSPIEVRKIVAQARATPSGFSRCHADGKSSLLLPSTERRGVQIFALINRVRERMEMKWTE